MIPFCTGTHTEHYPHALFLHVFFTGTIGFFKEHVHKRLLILIVHVKTIEHFCGELVRARQNDLSTTQSAANSFSLDQ